MFKGTIMREIKFRAWNNKNKEYYKGKIAIAADSILEFINDEWMTTELIPEQYIGLKDKNNKEIYENDILTSKCADTSKKLFLIEWESWGWVCKSLNNTNWPLHANQATMKYAEIIGNKYKNPELLEEKIGGNNNARI